MTEGNDMVHYAALLTAMTGDNSKPLLVAICLIVSVILMVVLIITGRNGKNDDKENDDPEE